MTLGIIVLAAGQGTRMRSDLPKVLHELGGKPLLQHVLDTCKRLSPEQIAVVIGHGADQVRARIHDAVDWVVQAEQLGTGHAVAQALPHMTTDRVLVVYGDVPLIKAETLAQLVAAGEAGGLALLTVELANPTGYGRIVRDGTGAVVRIVEEKDASAEVKRITEGNTGVMSARRSDFQRWLGRLRNDNAQGEYYLTDCVEHCIAEGGHIQALRVEDELEVSGVNNKRQLEGLERAFQRAQADALLEQAVTLADRCRIDIRGTVQAGRDVSIDVNCVFIGQVVLGNRVRIGPNCMIVDSTLGDGVEVLANSVIERAAIGPDCAIGPFARIRPDTVLDTGAKVGNFVEIKKSHIGAHSKVNHLSYVGDATVGQDVNIGAGTITCNYDGANKHRTVIEDQVFVGSNSALVAPLTLGKGATIGAGSVITKDAPEQKLTIARSRQLTLDGWQRPQKRKG